MSISSAELRYIAPAVADKVLGKLDPPRMKRGARKAARVAEERAIRDSDAGRDPIVLTLPYPPSANRYWRLCRGVLRRSDEANQFKSAVQFIAGDVIPFLGEVSVLIDIYRPQRSGDLDNRIKICLDALSGIAFNDDKQVVGIMAQRFDDPERPRAFVTVKSASSPSGGEAGGR